MGASKEDFMKQRESEDDWSDMFTKVSGQSFEEPITDEQCITITMLLESAKIPFAAKEEIKVSVEEKSVSSEQAYKCIVYLNNNINSDEITSGTNYNQTDISKKLKKEVA